MVWSWFWSSLSSTRTVQLTHALSPDVYVSRYDDSYIHVLYRDDRDHITWRKRGRERGRGERERETDRHRERETDPRERERKKSSRSNTIKPTVQYIYQLCCWRCCANFFALRLIAAMCWNSMSESISTGSLPKNCPTSSMVFLSRRKGWNIRSMPEGWESTK